MEVSELDGLRPQTFWSLRPAPDWASQSGAPPVYLVQYQMTGSAMLDTLFMPTACETAAVAYEEFTLRSTHNVAFCKVRHLVAARARCERW